MRTVASLAFVCLAFACGEADPDETLLRRIDAAEARMLRLAAGEEVGQSDDMDADVTLLLRTMQPMPMPITGIPWPRAC